MCTHVPVRHGTWSQEDLFRGLIALGQNFPETTVAEARRISGVPRQTLEKYWNQKKAALLAARAAGHPINAELLFSLGIGKKIIGRPQLLSPNEDYILMRVAERATDSFYPLKQHEICWEANRVLQRRKKPLRPRKGLSKGFAQGWMRRKKYLHILSMRRSQKLSPEKTRAMDSGMIKQHFDAVEALLRKHDMWQHLDRIWNADETSVKLSDCNRGRVVAPTGRRGVWVKNTAAPSRHVSLMFAICASGQKSPPIFLVPYKNPPREFTLAADKVGGKVLCTDKGFMTEETFLDWLKDWIQWLDENVRKDPSEKHMLIIDKCPAHGDHPNRRKRIEAAPTRVQEFAEKRNIVLYYLPGNSTHILQPADVAVYSPLKNYYRENIWDKRRKISPIEVPELVVAALEAACTPEKIQGAFRSAGLCPFFRERALPAQKAREKPSRIVPPPPIREALWVEHSGPLDMGQVEYADADTQVVESQLTPEKPKRSWTRKNLGLSGTFDAKRLREVFPEDEEDPECNEPSDPVSTPATKKTKKRKVEDQGPRKRLRPAKAPAPDSDSPESEADAPTRKQRRVDRGCSADGGTKRACKPKVVWDPSDTNTKTDEDAATKTMSSHRRNRGDRQHSLPKRGCLPAPEVLPKRISKPHGVWEPL
jgi:hypothetical protein